MTFRNGLASLLRPQDSVLVLIDHQPYQLTNLYSHEPQMVVNNATALAKAAKAFNVPTIAGLPRFNGGLVGYFGYDCVRYVEKRLGKCPIHNRA